MMLIGVSMIVAGVGWAFTEIRYEERLSQRPRTNRKRIVGYSAGSARIWRLAN
jgi:hypothetical protein